MKRYEFTKITISYFKPFRLYSTDSKVVNWFLDELKTISPSYKIIEQKKDSQGNLFYVNVDKLSDKDFEIEHLLIQHLCHNGWEPFAANERYEFGSQKTFLHFRLEKSI